MLPAPWPEQRLTALVGLHPATAPTGAAGSASAHTWSAHTPARRSTCSSAWRSHTREIPCLTPPNSGGGSPLFPPGVTAHFAAGHTQTHTRSLSLGEQIPAAAAGATRGAPNAPPPCSHCCCKYRHRGNPGGRRAGFPAGASPTPTPGLRRPGIPGTSWTWPVAPSRSPGLQGLRSLCRGCKPGAVTATLFRPWGCAPRASWAPGTPVSSHTWAPPARVPSARPEPRAPARPWGRKGDRGARRSRIGR